MEWERSSPDFHQSELVRLEGLKAAITAVQMAHLSELDRAQVATGDGSRSLSEWVAARLDLSRDTARSLVRTMRRTQDRADLREVLASGEVSFDRIEALSRIPGDVGLLEHLDVGAVHREAWKRARLTAEQESRTAADNYLFFQYTLDQTSARLRGGLDGYSASLVDQTLTGLADELPAFPDGTRGDSAWRKATALVGLCTTGEPATPAQVTVLVDSGEAAQSNGEAGVMIAAGSKASRQALEAILCDAQVELTVNAADGKPLAYGRRSRTVPPQLRRAILARNHGYCQVPGCNSRYRVEVHHQTPWSQGGATDPDNLVALCWFHHQIVIHQRGYTIATDPRTGRIQLIRPPPPETSS